MPRIPNIKFNNGKLFPVLGLGTWQGALGREFEVGQAVKDAIDVGYRHFDCAATYRNEKIVGAAISEKIANGTVKRENLFITSKLPNNAHGPSMVEKRLKTTLSDLGLDYLDLYLVHWPFAFKEGDDLVPIDSNGNIIFSDIDYVDTWKAMEDIYEKGLAKSIGVSNFNSIQIDRLLKHAKIVPVTNQIECHPYLNQRKLQEFCSRRDIKITAYSPLGSPARPWQKPGDPDVLNDAQIKTMAEKHNKTPAQILLRYQIQLGNATIPKSSNKERLIQNINIFDFELSPDDMKFINSFDCNGRICPYSNAKDHPLYPFQKHVEY
ncbi:hypothetical protein ILUMI_03417 [Ignelater luminosus]|uniref:NADP-dependent oxidoreductase domain-containing protein n=1 Tax=Ignelater luminosus TaxID=2038154 RepID=A0A8K0GIC4_IGNLU|nr:hypothetical protein ILUMI_03417 [Ignelater luminosus]